MSYSLRWLCLKTAKERSRLEVEDLEEKGSKMYTESRGLPKLMTKAGHEGKIDDWTSGCETGRPRWSRDCCP